MADEGWATQPSGDTATALASGLTPAARGTAGATTSQSSVAIADRLASGNRSYSFEFFPPKTDEGERTLWEALRQLEPLAPTFVSVTYGAGGSTRDRTVRVTGGIARETTLTPMGHLTCVGAAREEVRAVIGQYADAGVRNVLALRGDPPSGVDAKWEPHPNGMSYAVDLVALLRQVGNFCVGVAAFPEGHPESDDLDVDAQHLAAKTAAGASFAITQLFFNVDDYFRLVERTERHGATIPIIPGIMPVTNVRQIQRMAQMSGAAFPDDLAQRLLAVEDDPEAVRKIGVENASEMCDRLLSGGAPGLHFYTLNRSTATREIYQQLGLRNRR